VTAIGFPHGVRRLAFRSGADGLEDWALLWPPEQGSHWCVNIHGHGSHGDQLYIRPDVRRNWLPRFRNRGLGILTPNLRNDSWMGPRAATDLHALLQVVRREFGAEQFTFVGGSMGGSCNLIYAVLHPEDVASVAAMCPASDMASFYGWCEAHTTPAVLKEILEAIRAQYDGSPMGRPDVYRRHSCQKNVERLTMPVYVAHGDADALVPVGQSRALATLCRSPRFHYHEIPGGDHEAPIAATIMDEALAWILG
jgi:pimeloyl-ACP methyl ester carboxylesterase